MNYKHGMRKTRVYRIWCCMKNRCNNPNEVAYAQYGAVGIKVCDAWNASFESFFAHMGDCPPGWSIERLDNAKGYEPGNCVWADRTTQNRNRKSVRMLTVQGKTQSVAEWAEERGMSLKTLCTRLANGWPEEDAVLCPLVTKRAGVKRGESLRESFGAERGVKFRAPEGWGA